MRHLTASLLATTALLLAGATAPTLANPRTERVSVSSAEEQADNNSFAGVGISGYGQFVVFNSLATNLVPQDQNGAQDVFLRDRRNGTTALVSRSSSGEQANDFSAGPSVSRDGHFVAFSSRATNLVPGDTNSFTDLFVSDRGTKTTVLVSAAPGGQPADGSSSGKISGNGRFVAFNSSATNLVSGDANGVRDVFVRGLETGVTTLESRNLSGGPGGASDGVVAISGTGRYVVFASLAGDLVPGDTNGFIDIFLRDRKTGRTTLVSVDRAGGPADERSSGLVGGVSDNGTVVAFVSNASDLVEGDDIPESPDVFVRDLKAGTTTRIAPGINAGNVSADGRYVAFASDAPDLVPGDTNGEADDFVYDRRTGAITRVNVSRTGKQAVFGGAAFRDPQISASANAVAFVSAAGNLVPGDTNGASDVFVRTR